MLGVIVKKINKYEDPRGWLAEFYREDEINYRPAMAYVSLTKPGIVRGPHEHREQADYFVFLGPGDFVIHLWDGRENSPTKGEYQKFEVGANNPSLVIVPSGVVHGYKCVSSEGGLCINLADKLYKGENKKEEVDEIRWEQREDSPYKIE
jgi:dTDP-4-dehydrorhamnose 3,5-epimerase